MNPWKVAAAVLGALVLQVCLFSRFSYEGARPDVVILLAIAAGLVAGPDRGAMVGFAAGLSFDVLLTTPLGLSALVYVIVGYVAGALGWSVLRVSWWIAPAMVALGSAAGMLLYAMVGEVLGQATLSGPSLTDIVVVVSVVNAVLAPLAVRVMRWAQVAEHAHRRHPYLAR